MGPSARAGKNESAATIMITTNVISEKVNVSVFNVPALSGTYFFDASSPAMATCPMMGKKRPMIRTIPVEIFQNGVLSAKPSNPDPLFAAEEVY